MLLREGLQPSVLVSSQKSGQASGSLSKSEPGTAHVKTSKSDAAQLIDHHCHIELSIRSPKFVSREKVYWVNEERRQRRKEGRESESSR